MKTYFSTLPKSQKTILVLQASCNLENARNARREQTKEARRNNASERVRAIWARKNCVSVIIPLDWKTIPLRQISLK